MLNLNLLIDAVEGATDEALNMSLMDCHVDGVFSLVVKKADDGCLTRFFIATKDIEFGDVAPHSHKYNIWLSVLAGNFTHHSFVEGGRVVMSGWKYKSSDGSFRKVYAQPSVEIRSENLPVSSEMYIRADDIRTISCKAGAIWAIEETSYTGSLETIVLGVPFKTDGLYKKPAKEQVLEMKDRVYSVLLGLRDLFKEGK
jgi:hypothetical protein